MNCFKSVVKFFDPPGEKLEIFYPGDVKISTQFNPLYKYYNRINLI